MIEKVHKFADKFKLKKNNTNTPITLNMEDEDDTIESESQSEQDSKSDYSISYNKQLLNNELNALKNVDPDRPVGQIIPNDNTNYASDMSEMTISQRSKKSVKKIFRDIFEESTIEEADELERTFINNDNNIFLCKRRYIQSVRHYQRRQIRQ